MAETKKKRVYSYIRVSTEMQVDGYSLDSQRDRLKREAKAKDWKIIKEYADEGKSGGSIAGRPQFKEMLERIKSGNPDKVEYIIVYKLSRFGRNTSDMLNSLKVMQRNGVELYCADEGIDSGGSTGKLIITLLAAVSEIEKESIRTQTMAGRHQKAREGKWNGGQAPYGYKINKDTSVLEIDEEEAPIVQMMFEQFAYHQNGANGVARWLEANGYRKKLRGNGKYALFSAHTVKTILDNPVYTGKIAYGRRRIERVVSDDEETEKIRRLNNEEYGIYEGRHEAIISDELWADVRAKREATSVRHEKTHSLEHEHLLSGILKCPQCGAPMYGTVNRKRKKDGSGYYKDAFYYVCKHRKMIDGQKCTYKRQPPQDPINNEVIAIVREAMTSPNMMVEMKEHMDQKTDTSELTMRLEALQKTRNLKMRAVNRLSAEMDILDIEDETAYDIAYSDMLSRQRTLYAEIADIDRDIHLVQSDLQKEADADATMEAAYEMLKAASDQLMSDDLSDLGKKMMLGTMVQDVELFPERQEDGRYVKSVTFQFPVFIEGEWKEKWWSKEHTVETVVLLS